MEGCGGERGVWVEVSGVVWMTYDACQILCERASARAHLFQGHGRALETVCGFGIILCIRCMVKNGIDEGVPVLLQLLPHSPSIDNCR